MWFEPRPSTRLTNEMFPTEVFGAGTLSAEMTSAEVFSAGDWILDIESLRRSAPASM